MTANVGVSFPSGLITEWYPQAAQIGPAAFVADDDFDDHEGEIQDNSDDEGAVDLF